MKAKLQAAVEAFGEEEVVKRTFDAARALNIKLPTPDKPDKTIRDTMKWSLRAVLRGDHGLTWKRMHMWEAGLKSLDTNPLPRIDVHEPRQNGSEPPAPKPTKALVGTEALRSRLLNAYFDQDDAEFMNCLREIIW